MILLFLVLLAAKEAAKADCTGLRIVRGKDKGRPEGFENCGSCCKLVCVSIAKILLCVPVPRTLLDGKWRLIVSVASALALDAELPLQPSGALASKKCSDVAVTLELT